MSSGNTSADVLRARTDDRVLRALFERKRATRAELSADTGLSKPTVSESIRRLAHVGAVADTGERTTGPGRIGSYYGLPASAGCALVADIAPDRLLTSAIDVHGDMVGSSEGAVAVELDERDVASALRQQALTAAHDRPIRLAVMSAAEPVDRRTGRLIELPDAPLVLGALDPPTALSGIVHGPIDIDNDVNWAARAEHRCGRTAGVTDFVYLYLGEGLGCAVVSDGAVRRGAVGIAGEIAHVITTGPDGIAMRLIDVFAALDLRRPGSTAIHVAELLRAVDADSSLRRSIATAVAGVLSAAVALVDPAIVVVGGSWGRHESVHEAIVEQFALAPRDVEVVRAALGTDAIVGELQHTAVERLRDAVIAAASTAET